MRSKKRKLDTNDVNGSHDMGEDMFGSRKFDVQEKKSLRLPIKLANGHLQEVVGDISGQAGDSSEAEASSDESNPEILEARHKPVESKEQPIQDVKEKIADIAQLIIQDPEENVFPIRCP